MSEENVVNGEKVIYLREQPSLFLLINTTVTIIVAAAVTFHLLAEPHSPIAQLKELAAFTQTQAEVTNAESEAELAKYRKEAIQKNKAEVLDKEALVLQLSTAQEKVKKLTEDLQARRTRTAISKFDELESVDHE